MLKIKKQINLLYVTSILGNLSITGAWVAKTHFDDIRKYEEESSRRIAEIDIQIAALDREMIDLYEKYN